MMLESNAAADLNPRGLRQPFPGQGKALGRGHPARTRTRTRTRTGWDGRGIALAGVYGLGAMTEAEAIAILGGAQQSTATKEQMDEAYAAYYDKAGYYSQEVSVQAAAAAEPSYYDAGLPSGPPAPMLYPAKVCGAAEMGSTDCVSYNAQVQQANLVLQENARRAWNLLVCEHNAAVNPGTDMPCTQYQGALPVPAAPSGAVKQQAVCTSGECYTPFMGGTPTTTSTAPAREIPILTPQQAASFYSGRPNQSVPPRPQGGEVPTGGTAPAPPPTSAGDGLILGFEPTTLAIIAAVGVGALLLLRK